MKLVRKRNILSSQTDKVSRTQSFCCLKFVKQYRLRDKVFYCEKQQMYTFHLIFDRSSTWRFGFFLLKAFLQGTAMQFRSFEYAVKTLYIQKQKIASAGLTRH